MKQDENTYMKIQFDGDTTNWMQKNRQLVFDKKGSDLYDRL